MASAKLALPSFVLVALAGLVGIDRTPMVATAMFEHQAGAIPQSVDRLATPFTHPRGPQGGVAGRDARAQVDVALALIWVAGCLCVAGRWWVRRRRLSRAVASGRTLLAGREHDTLALARARVGTTRLTPLVLSRGVGQPGVCGVLRPVIVLPDGIADRLSDSELERVLVHELVHVRRQDNLIANLHMALCCLFWFYPVVWLIDRRLLREREQVCDDEVLRLSGAPEVYAASLLKVFTYSLGPGVAGVSAAAGTALRDRVKRIADHRGASGRNGAHRALVGAAATVLALFLVAGALGLGTSEPRASNVAPTPIASAQQARLSGLPPERVADTPPEPIAFDNATGAPVLIRRATVRIVPLDPGASSERGGEALVTPPTLVLENVSGHRVAFVRIGFESSPRWHDVVGFEVAMEAHDSYVLEPDWHSWSNTVRGDEIGRLVTRVVGVRFENGAVWGSLDDDPPSAEAPRAEGTPRAPAASGRRPRELSPAEPAEPPVEPAGPAVWYPARFENPEGAPVTIVEARTPATRSDRTGVSALPVVTLANVTDRRITHLKLRFKAGTPAHAVSAFAVDVPPGGTYVFRSRSTFDGDPERMSVQVLGVRFEEGDIWGAFDTLIDTREETVSVPQFIHRPDR